MAKAILDHLKAPDTKSGLIGASKGAVEPDQLMKRLAGLLDMLRSPESKLCRELLMSIVTRVDLTLTNLTSTLDFRAALGVGDIQELDDEYELTLKAPIQIKRRGGELKLVLQGAAHQASTPDENLVTAILDARRRFAEYTHKENLASISEIAATEGISAGDVSRSMQLAFLAPNLIEAILNGQQPIEMTATRLKRRDALPLLWEDQRRVLA